MNNSRFSLLWIKYGIQIELVTVLFRFHLYRNAWLQLISWIIWRLGVWNWRWIIRAVTAIWRESRQQHWKWVDDMGTLTTSNKTVQLPGGWSYRSWSMSAAAKKIACFHFTGLSLGCPRWGFWQPVSEIYRSLTAALKHRDTLPCAIKEKLIRFR